jgi:hypothetical protein
MSGLSDHNPFVGPRPIQRGEALYGRKTEVRELHEQLQARRIVVLHSPSGAGKSSLVQAGLIPRLERSKFFDVWRPIRVNLDPVNFEGLPDGTNRYLLSAMVSLEDELPEAHRRSPVELATLGFRTYLETRPRRKSRADHSVVLLFDQFEEVLSVAPRDVEAKEAFFTQVGEALDADKYWALFIIREDYLAALAPYRDRIPTQLSNTFRLDLLGVDGAREAAVKLVEEGGRSFPAVDKLIRDLSSVHVQRPDGTFAVEQGLHVEPVHLQVVCRRLWDAMPEDDLSIDEEDIEAYAGVSTSLAGYYADAVRNIADGDPALERAIRDWVGTKLIVGGIRSQIRREAGNSSGLDNEHIQKLLDSYLVRTEQRAGASWFELGHDRLVEPILEDNEAWRRGHLHPLQVQATLWEDGGRGQALLLGSDALPDALAWAEDNPTLVTEAEREFLDASQARCAEQAVARRRQRIFTTALAVVALAALALGLFARSLQINAEQKRHEAEQAQHDAEQAQHEAELLRRRADTARGDAEKAKLRALGAQKKNERLARDVLRQMFQIALRRFVDGIGKGDQSGEIEVDERWTPLLERGNQRFAAANIIDGGGRIIVAGNAGLLGEPLFLEISGEWLLGDQARRGVAVLTQRRGSYRRLEALRRGLSAMGYAHEIDPALDGLAEQSEIGLLVVDNRWSPELRPEDVATVEAFVRGGGGLLAVGDGHEWLDHEAGEGEPTPTLDNYPMNELITPFGARFTGETIAPETFDKHADEAAVYFENRRWREVEIFARGYERREEYFMTLAPGEARDIRSSIGHEWVIRDAEDGQVIGEAGIEYAHQIVTIGDTVKSKKAPSKTGGPRPAPKDEDSELPKTLSNAAMRKAKAAAERASKVCGSTHGSLIPTAKVRFEVGPDGRVLEAEALPPMKGTRVGTCVAKAVSDQRFPKSRTGVSKTWTLPL